MRKTVNITGVSYLVVGLLLAIGPKTIFSVCSSDGDMVMKCFYTAQAELAVGIEIAVLGLLQLILKSEKAATTISIVSAISGIVAFAIPNFLIGVCGNVHMHCHSVTKPALSILSILLTIISLASAYVLYRNGAAVNEKESTYDQEIST